MYAQCEYLPAMALVRDSNNKADASETCVFDNIIIPRIDGSNWLRGFSDTPIVAGILYVNGTSKNHRDLIETTYLLRIPAPNSARVLGSYDTGKGFQ